MGQPRDTLDEIFYSSYVAAKAIDLSPESKIIVTYAVTPDGDIVARVANTDGERILVATLVEVSDEPNRKWEFV